MIRLVIVGLHQQELDGMRAILESHQDIRIVGSGHDGYDAINLVKKHKPDIALLDADLALLNASDATKSLKQLSPKTKIIIFSETREDERVLKAINNGAAGYLLKQFDLVRAHWLIRVVYFGYSLMSPEIAAKAHRMYQAKNPHAEPATPSVPRKPKVPILPNITRHELAVISCIGKGLSNKEIAEYLKLKDGTIRNSLTSIYQKTGLRNRIQVAIYAHRIGLLGEVD